MRGRAGAARTPRRRKKRAGAGGKSAPKKRIPATATVRKPVARKAAAGGAGPLPKAFAALTPFLDWARDSERARNAKRTSSTMAEIRAFYEAMHGCIDAALEYLNARPLDRLSEPDRRLFLLVMALPEAANAIELFEEPGNTVGMAIGQFVPVHDL